MSRKQLIDRVNIASQRVGNRTTLFTNAISNQIGLSATEFESFDIFDEKGPITAGELAKATGLTTGAVTGLVDRLERAGFVKRTADPSDRRKVIITPLENTEAKRKVSELYQPLGEAFQKMVARYSDEELIVIADYLERAAAMMAEVGDQMRREQ